MSKLKLPIHSLKRKGLIIIYIYIKKKNTIWDSSIDASNPKEHFKNFNKKFLYIIYVGSQIVAHTLTGTGNGPNRPNTINL